MAAAATAEVVDVPSLVGRIQALEGRLAPLEALGRDPLKAAEAAAIRAGVLEQLEALVDAAQKELLGDHAPAEAAAAEEPAEAGKYPQKLLRRAFEAYDKDASGYLEQEEVAALAKQLGSDTEAETLKQALMQLDTSGDGKISFEEFATFMTQEEQSGSATGKLTQQIRAKMLRQKFARQMSRLKGRAAGQLAPKPKDLEGGVSRSLDIEATVGDTAGVDFPTKITVGVEATPRKEAAPDSSLDCVVRVRLKTREGVSEEQLSRCIEIMQQLYTQAVEGGAEFKSFAVQRLGTDLQAELHLDPEELIRATDNFFFLKGASEATGGRIKADVHLGVDLKQMAESQDGLSLLKMTAGLVRVKAQIMNDAWFAQVMRLVFKMGAPDDSSDEEDQGDGSDAEDEETRLANMPNFKTLLRFEVLPRLLQWALGSRLKFSFASWDHAAQEMGVLWNESKDRVRWVGKDMLSLIFDWKIDSYWKTLFWALDPEEGAMLQSGVLSEIQNMSTQHGALHETISGPQSVELELLGRYGDVKMEMHFQGLDNLADFVPSVERYKEWRDKSGDNADEE